MEMQITIAAKNTIPKKEREKHKSRIMPDGRQKKNKK